MNIAVDLTGVVLETERLILRSWRESDLQDFFEYASVDGVGQMAGWNPHKSIEESEKILKLFIDEKKTFALELKENHKVIGSLGLENMSTSINAFYDKLYGREIGYVLSKDYWGRGLMPEAVKKVIDFCFCKLGCDYLICSCSLENSQSKRVIEKCGFRFALEKQRTLGNGTQRIALYHIIDNPNLRKNEKYPWISDYLTSKKGVVKDYKPRWDWDRYMIDGKMFAAVCYDEGERKLITLKLEPTENEFMRSQYEDIIPGYYMNKQHWSSVKAEGNVPEDILKDMLDKSYKLLLGSLSRKRQSEILGD